MSIGWVRVSGFNNLIKNVINIFMCVCVGGGGSAFVLENKTMVLHVRER